MLPDNKKGHNAEQLNSPTNQLFLPGFGLKEVPEWSSANSQRGEIPGRTKATETTPEETDNPIKSQVAFQSSFFGSGYRCAIPLNVYLNLFGYSARRKRKQRASKAMLKPTAKKVLSV